MILILKIDKGVEMYNLYLLSVVVIIECRSSLLWVVDCVAGICLNIFFVCGGDRVAWKIWGQRYFSREGARGFSKQLATGSP